MFLVELTLYKIYFYLYKLGLAMSMQIGFGYILNLLIVCCHYGFLSQLTIRIRHLHVTEI